MGTEKRATSVSAVRIILEIPLSPHNPAWNLIFHSPSIQGCCANYIRNSGTIVPIPTQWRLASHSKADHEGESGPLARTSLRSPPWPRPESRPSFQPLSIRERARAAPVRPTSPACRKAGCAGTTGEPPSPPEAERQRPREQKSLASKHIRIII